MSQDNESADPLKPEESRRSSPRLKIPVPPDLPLDDPETGSPHRRLSTMVGINFLLLLVLVLMLGFLILKQTQSSNTAPAPARPADATRPEDKSVAGEVDRLKAEIAGLTKKLGEMPAAPDPTPQIKSLDDKVAELGKSVGEMPARLDSLTQKVDAVGKGEGSRRRPRSTRSRSGSARSPSGRRPEGRGRWPNGRAGRRAPPPPPGRRRT